MTKVLITRNLPERTVNAAQARFDVTYRDSPAPMSEAEMVASLAEHDGVLTTLGDRYAAEVFDQVASPRCRILANFGVGYNHIDVAAAHAAGLTVTNTPGAVTDATADIALTLLLMSARRAGEGERLVRAGLWRGWHPVQMLGLHASGKTVGIVGMGRIGQAVARRCHHGFGMQVAYTSRSEKTLDLPARYFTSVEALAAEVDFLVICVPGGPQTRHMIGASVFEKMRPGAHLVNVARGDVIDEVSLVNALEARKIAGAGLDVYENEPAVPERLRRLETVVLLPHLGTAALEVREDMGQMAVDNLAAFFDGAPVPNKVSG